MRASGERGFWRSYHALPKAIGNLCRYRNLETERSPTMVRYRTVAVDDHRIFIGKPVVTDIQPCSCFMVSRAHVSQSDPAA
jgi:hypothetical protein